MLTKDDLNQIRTVVKEEVQAETKPIKAEMQGMKTEMRDMKQALTRIEQKLDREVTDLAENMGEIMNKLDVLDDHETRISQLEKRSAIPHSH